jgi:hypothetical protein
MSERGLKVSVFVLIGALFACKAGQKSDPKPVASTTVAVPAAPTEQAFTNVVPKQGTKVATDRRTTSKFTMAGKVFRQETSLQSSFEVQASDEFRVTRGAIDIKDLYAVDQEGTGAEKKTVSPLAGSRFVVTRADDGKLSALDSQGNKVPASQLKLLKDEFGEDFEKNQTGAFLPDRPVKIGEKLTPASDVMLRMLAIKDDGNTLIDGTEFFLRSSTADRATFDCTMTMTQKLVGSGLRLRAKLKGTMDIQPNGTWPLGVDLKGPITLIDASGNEKGSGEASFFLTQRFS